jgi:hypothetical protein
LGLQHLPQVAEMLGTIRHFLFVQNFHYNMALITTRLEIEIGALTPFSH